MLPIEGEWLVLQQVSSQLGIALPEHGYSKLYAEVLTKLPLTEHWRDRADKLAEQIQQHCLSLHGTAPGLPAPSSRPHEGRLLPRPLDVLIGRGEELDLLDSLVARPGLVTIVGEGGCGKTRLAIEGVQRMHDFGPCIWFIQLDRLSNASEVYDLLCLELDIERASTRSNEDMVRSYLSDKRALLVLDNCEHLLPSLGQIATDLRTSAPNLTILATSREILRLHGEQVLKVEPLSTDPSLEELPDAQALFVDRAQSLSAQRAELLEHLEDVNAICRVLEGNPLAIEIAASRIDDMTLSQIREGLNKPLELLQYGYEDVPDRQRAVSRAILWSYQLLSLEAQLVFKRLSAFRGSWDDSAISVCQDQELDSASVKRSVQELLRLRLIIHDRDQGRYSMRFLTREVACELLAATANEQAVRNRHLEFFLQLVEKAEAGLTSSDQLQWIERLEVEQHNVRGALDWAISSENTLAAYWMLGCLWYFWSIQEDWGECRRYLEQLSAMDKRPTRERAKALWCASFMEHSLGELDQATRLCKECLEISTTLEDRRLQGFAISIMATIANNKCEYPAAAELADKGLHIWRELEDSGGSGWMLNTIAPGSIAVA